MDIAAPLDPFADPRNRMVDSQIRPNKVTDPRILAAMRRVPRERFLPPALVSQAYTDEDVKLGRGRVLMAPMATAKLLQLLAPVAGERVLVVASGVGYGAAVLAACGARVVALEEDAALLALARPALAALAPEVMQVAGPLEAGWAADAPYDAVLIEGAVTVAPSAVVAQLRQGTGRLVTVLRAGAGVGQAVLGEVTPAGPQMRPAFDCATPLIPSLAPKPGFTF